MKTAADKKEELRSVDQSASPVQETSPRITPEKRKEYESHRRRLESTTVFATNLRFLLQRNGMTAKQFAKEFGTTPQTVSSWMTSSRSPHAAKVEDVARFFGVRAIDMQDPLGNAGLIPSHDISVKVPIAGTNKKETASFVPAGSKTRLTTAMICEDDEMSPVVKNGDIVLYTAQASSFREGALVVVRRSNNTMTIRRIYLYDNEPTFILAADGCAAPETYPKDQLTSIVAGKAVFIQRNIENA